MIKLKFLYIPPTPFYYKPPSCPPNPLLINHIFSWESRLKHAGVYITSFFEDVKSSLTKHKSVFWKRLMGPVKHLSGNFLQKKVNSFYPKTISAKNFTLDAW